MESVLVAGKYVYLQDLKVLDQRIPQTPRTTPPSLGRIKHAPSGARVAVAAHAPPG